MARTMKDIFRPALVFFANLFPFSSDFLGGPKKIACSKELLLNNEGESRVIIKKSIQVVELAPKSVTPEIFFKFVPLYIRYQPEQFILQLSQARVWGNHGAIITRDDTLVSDLSKEFEAAKFNVKKHSIFNRIKLRRPEKFNGALAVIASPGSNVYAHWFCDVLPRLMLLKENGFLENTNGILVNYSKFNFQTDTLERLGIPEEQLINCKMDLNFHITADILYVPSYPNEHGTVNRWVCEAVRSLYKTELTETSTGNKRLYVSREKAKGRKVINEGLFFSLLEEKYDFVKIYAEDYSMVEKVKLFSQAECIIGAHGGGLTNIIFSSTGCKIIDIFPPGDFDTFFWSIANANNLEYYYFFGKGEMPTPENDFMQRNVDIHIDIGTFEILLESLKLENRN